MLVCCNVCTPYIAHDSESKKMDWIPMRESNLNIVQLILEKVEIAMHCNSEPPDVAPVVLHKLRLNFALLAPVTVKKIREGVGG